MRSGNDDIKRWRVQAWLSASPGVGWIADHRVLGDHVLNILGSGNSRQRATKQMRMHEKQRSKQKQMQMQMQKKKRKSTHE